MWHFVQNFTNFMDILLDSYVKLTLICRDWPMITPIFQSQNENMAEYAIPKKSSKNDLSRSVLGALSEST